MLFDSSSSLESRTYLSIPTYLSSSTKRKTKPSILSTKSDKVMKKLNYQQRISKFSPKNLHEGLKMHESMSTKTIHNLNRNAASEKPNNDLTLSPSTV
jgi:hypothetical protein